MLTIFTLCGKSDSEGGRTGVRPPQIAVSQAQGTDEIIRFVFRAENTFR